MGSETEAAALSLSLPNAIWEPQAQQNFMMIPSQKYFLPFVGFLRREKRREEVFAATKAIDDLMGTHCVMWESEHYGVGVQVQYLNLVGGR